MIVSHCGLRRKGGWGGGRERATIPAAVLDVASRCA
jgi:hypothetical protein